MVFLFADFSKPKEEPTVQQSPVPVPVEGPAAMSDVVFETEQV